MHHTWFNSSVCLHVFLHMKAEVIATCKCALAELTLERTFTGVFAVVAGEFIRTSELPSATLPAAVVRLLASVGTEVSLQVGAL